MKEQEAERLLRILMQEGEVVCESPKVRKLMYRRLEAQGVRWESETIGTTGGRKPLNPWLWGVRPGLGYSPGRIFHWLEGERLDQDELVHAYRQYSSWSEYSKVSEADIRELFDPEARRDPVRKEHIFETLRELMPENKYGPFDSVGITKVIKRIRLLDQPKMDAQAGDKLTET